MCSPTALMLTATGTRAYGSYKRSKAQKDSLRYNAVQRRDLAEQYIEQADEIERQGQLEQSDVALKGKIVKGRNISKISGSGVMAGKGTAGKAIQDIDLLSRLERRMILNETLKKSSTSLKKSQSLYKEANMLDARADSINPLSDAFTSGLSSGVSAYGGLSEGGQDKIGNVFDELFGTKKKPKKITKGYEPSGLILDTISY